jgi:hypothetical protein
MEARIARALEELVKELRRIRKLMERQEMTSEAEEDGDE